MRIVPKERWSFCLEHCDEILTDDGAIYCYYEKCKFKEEEDERGN